MHDLTLDEEIQLARQESVQILVDEIIESVLRHIALQMLLQQGCRLPAFASGDRRDQRIQLCPMLGQQPCRNCGIVLLCILLFLVCGNIIHESDHDLAGIRIVFKGF